MTIILASIGSLAAANGAAQPISAESIYWPAWILVGGVLIALLIVIGVLTSLKAALLAKPKKRDAEFTRMLCKQVWKHTDAVTDTFAQRLRQPQRDVVTLRVLLRLLREDLAGPVNFVEQMRPQTPASWPHYDLFAAFNNWGGLVAAMESQLADLQQMLSYPAVREPADAHQDAMLVHYYATEQVAMGQMVATLGNAAIAVCDAAKTVLRKETGHGFSFGGGQDHDDEDHGCTACGNAHAHSIYTGNARDVLPLPEVPERPKKKEEAHMPAAHGCRCAVPQPCLCLPACACACSCKAPSPAPAHH